MRTGLLSLNIHDSLTFDGCELCLHPDLFATEAWNAASSQQTRKSQEESTNSNAGKNGGTVSSAASGMSASQDSSPLHQGLSVGDMLEIRVWDPVPQEGSLLNGGGRTAGITGYRKPSRAQSTPIASTTISGAPVDRRSVGAIGDTPVELSSIMAPPSTNSTGRTQTKLRGQSEHLEDDSNDTSTAGSSTDKGDRPEPAESPSSGGAGSASARGERPGGPSPPTKTVVTTNVSSNITNAVPSLLPPVFPRQRANTAEAHAVPPNANNKPALISRPAPIHRRATSGTSSQRSPNQSTRHIREISDVTVDIHQLDSSELTIPHNDSHDEDGASDNDIWSKISAAHHLRLSFVLLVTEKTLTSLKGNTRTQVSMLRQVADLYSLSSYDMVTVHKVDPQEEEDVLKAVSADFVVVTIKDRFISRGDMHLFQNGLQGTWIYEGQRLTEATRQLKAHAREIRHGNKTAKSGIITEKTMITFRSRSARIMWLVQMSSEMWDYASPYEHKDHPEGVCEIYFDQWIRFLYKLFEKWKALEVSHSLTILFFSRTFLSGSQKSNLNCRDVYGRAYEDHYKTVIEDETCTEWDSLIVRIKEEFVRYPLDIGWNLTDRRASSASQGNVLEAINVSLNTQQYHFLDRDLHRTGNSLVVVSPGCGVFEVDKGLAGITYQRMMDNGIGSDMLSLGLPPLHIAPFFLYNNEFRTVETGGVDANESYYEVPHWMHLSFVNYDREAHEPDEQSYRKNEWSAGVRRNGDDTIKVGPNGFLLPTSGHSAVAEGLKSTSPLSSFSAMGNNLATPVQGKIKQKMELISPREFRDILEACRPRLSGTRLPSALSSILKLKQALAESRNTSLKLDGAMPVDSHTNRHFRQVTLREWGTVDFSEIPALPKAKLARSDSPNARKSHVEGGVDKSDDSESGSNSSSFASHVSSMFGMSYDRVLWDHYESPGSGKSTVQIQRAPSLEYEKSTRRGGLGPGSTNGEDLTSVGTDNASKCSTGQGSVGGLEESWIIDNDTTATQVSKHEKHIETLKKIMDAHDARVWASTEKQTNTIGEINIVRPESLQHVESDATLSSMKRVPNSSGQESKASGGLGAALSQYSNTTPKEGPPSVLLARRPAGSPGLPSASTFQQERARASSPLFPPVSQIHEMGSRAMSPMLLPPMMAQTSTLTTEQHSSTPLQIGSFERHDSIPPFGAVASGRQDYASFHASLQGNVTLPNGDSSRYLIRPISRSPPSAGLRSSHQGILAISPPSSGVTREKSLTRPTRQEVARSSSPPSGNVAREPVMPRGNSREFKSVSPTNVSVGGARERETYRLNSRELKGTSQKSAQSSRHHKKTCNPFRQSDEDEVLAKRSHNRRRWSHVFPVGEVEFKRHSGPLWKSLTAPAILPLSVDYFPSPQELRDVSRFQFSPYTVTLSGIENKHYSTHAELMLEMVRQRLTQDFQVVTAAAVDDSERRPEPQRPGRKKNKPNKANSRREPFVPSLPPIKHDTRGTIRHYLSMGHRIQVISYDPSSDAIEIVHYNEKGATNDPLNVYAYRFLLYSKATEQYTQSIQTFKKYNEPYKWNKVDNLICGEDDRALDIAMRFRRVIFGLIPGEHQDLDSEQEYVGKFQRLLEYLGKLRENEDAETALDVKIVSSSNKVHDNRGNILGVRRATTDFMTKFTVQLRKGKRDPFEWMEIAVDSTFDTSSSYRIMFNWLVASSAKVETQIQLLHRRCSQFGLQLITFPQMTISANLFLNAFVVPTLMCVRDKVKADTLDEELKKIDFVEDGINFTSQQVLMCIDNSAEFDFPRFRSGKLKDIPARQYVHRSGALFMRNIRDRQGWAILAATENYRHATKENGIREIASKVLHQVSELINKDYEAAES